MRPAGKRVLLVPDGALYLAFRQLPILAAAGLRIDVLSLRDDPVVYSRYVDDILQVDSLDALTGRVEKIIRSGFARWSKIIVTHEDVVRQLAERVDPKLLAAWQAGIVLAGMRDFMRSKEGLVGARENWGLPIPLLRICQNPGEIAALGNEAGWPIVSKPLLGYGGHGLQRLESAADTIKAGLVMRFPVLAQKYIQGRRGVVDMLCTRGRPIAWLASFSTRRVGGEYGSSTGRRFESMPHLSPLVNQVAEATRFDGFCGFDWILEDGTGEVYLIEFHARAPSGFRFWRDCGVDFAAAVQAWLEPAKALPDALRQVEGKVVETAYFPMDLTRCLKEHDWPGLQAWWPWSKFRHDIFWDDLPLLLGWIGSRVWLICKGLRRRLLGT